MTYAVTLCEVQSSYLAAVRATVNRRNLGATIRQILSDNQVYQFVKRRGLEKVGHNVFIYRTDQDKTVGNLAEEFVIEVGVQVADWFEGDGQVICSSTPQGRAVTTLHTGYYDQLGPAHTAVREWARQQGLPLTGLNWEVYGDWQQDPNQMTTEVFYLLQ